MLVESSDRELSQQRRHGIKFFESCEGGYTRVEVTPQLWRTDLRMMSSVTQPDATARDLAPT